MKGKMQTDAMNLVAGDSTSNKKLKKRSHIEDLEHRFKNIYQISKIDR